MKIILQVILILLFIGYMAFMAIDPTGRVREERELQHKIDNALYEAQELKDKRFCEEYIKIVDDKSKAPYAYKHCFK